jgi:hypothetical protein
MVNGHLKFHELGWRRWINTMEGLDERVLPVVIVG